MDDPNVMRDAMLGRMNAANARPVRSTRIHPATEVFAARCTDDEASALLDELSKLQHMMVMNMSRGREWVAASDLVQRTRILIIQRCKRPTIIDERS